MRLLVVTQAVDTEDMSLGFFHRWLELLSEQCESLIVICLKEGPHALPAHVRVLSLGKESGRSRFKYVARFYYYILRFLFSYDQVLVHMNQEYALLGGALWRLSGKRFVLWRNHRRGSIWTTIACLFPHAVCYTSPDAFVKRFPKSIQMPIGIDTDMFALPRSAGARSVLLFGRLDPVKKPEVFVAALSILRAQGISFSATLAGSPTEAGSPFAEELLRVAQPLVEAGMLVRRSALPHRETPALYASHAVYVNLTPSGSFDKTIGEAFAAGCIPVVANRAVADVVPPELLIDPESPQSVARGIRHALEIPEAERAALSRRLRQYLEERHSLRLLIAQLDGILASS